MQKESDGGRLVYRLIVIFAELYFGASSVGTIVSRARRQQLESLSQSTRETPFVLEDMLTLLTVTDEDAKAITASVNSHYAAAKPGKPFRVVLVAEMALSLIHI